MEDPTWGGVWLVGAVGLLLGASVPLMCDWFLIGSRRIEELCREVGNERRRAKDAEDALWKSNRERDDARRQLVEIQRVLVGADDE